MSVCFDISIGGLMTSMVPQHGIFNYFYIYFKKDVFLKITFQVYNISRPSRVMQTPLIGNLTDLIFFFLVYIDIFLNTLIATMNTF